MSLPHWIVAVPQTRAKPGSPSVILLGEKRLRTTCKRPCSSRPGSPDELIGKQYRISPRSFTAMRKRSVCGVSSFDAAKRDCGMFATPNRSSSLENEMYVLSFPAADKQFENHRNRRRGRSTTAPRKLQARPSAPGASPNQTEAARLQSRRHHRSLWRSCSERYRRDATFKGSICHSGNCFVRGGTV